MLDHPIFIDEVPTHEIKKDLMHIRAGGFEFVLPINIALAGMADGQRVVAEWERQSAAIVQFPRKKGGVVGH